MSTTSETDSNRQTVISDIGDLKEFESEPEIFRESFKFESKDDDNKISIETLASTQSDNVEFNGFKSGDSLSSIQELLLYVEESNARYVGSQNNVYNDSGCDKMKRESFCDFNKRCQRKKSSVKLFKAHCICPIASNTLDNTIQGSESSKLYEQHVEHEKISRSPVHVLFEVEPYSVLFLNCEPGKTYVKSIKVTNRTKWMQKFDVDPLPQSSPFKMKIILPTDDCTRNTIAAGLSFRIQITYSCKGHENFKETLRIEGGFVSPILIQVRVHQCQPILAELTAPENLFEESEAIVICNSCLPTESTVTRVELLNYSKTFKFLILDKDMWSLQTLETLCTNNDNTLIAGVFTISPIYFQTSCEAFVVLNVQFSPPKAGKYCRKLYIICDNMSVRSLQLIGQAYPFNKNMLKFLNMDKTYLANVNDCIEAKYLLDLGSVYRGKKKSKRFTILNGSPCTLNFHWEFHRYPLPGFKRMTSRMIDLSHKQGSFIGKKSRKFSANINMTRATEGEYRTLACLYVDNLNEAKVDDSLKEDLLNRSKRKGYSQLVARIEIHVRCKCVRIEPNTRVISLARIPLLCGPQHKYSTYVTIKNKSLIPARCVWKSLDFNGKIRAKLEVRPTSAKISAKCGRIFEISVTGLSPGSFRQYLICTANVNEHRVAILVEGECTMGFLHVRDDFISCGPIRKDDKLCLDVSFENYTNQKWTRMLTEYRYHSRKSYKLPKLTDNPKRKSCKKFVALYYKKRGLYDNYSRFISFKYDRVNTNIVKDVIWCSLLKMKLGDVEDFIGVIADIERPLLTISENAASDDFLLMNYTSVIRLNLKNHSRISASFTWVHAIGDDSSSFECKFVPSAGVIKPHEKWQIMVYLKPLERIKVEDLHLICIVDGMVSPLLVSVTGYVQPLIIELNWLENRNDTQQHTFVWESIGEHSTSSRPSDDSSCQIPEEFTNNPTFDYCIGNLEINNVIKVDKIEEDSNSAILYCYKLSSFNMKQRFYSIKKIVIELDSCQIANKAVIQMVNRTDASVSYTTDILNFHPNEEPISKQKIPDEHDYKRWKSMIQPEMGVVVCIENPSGQLTNNDGTTELSIWAFATSWGVYRDVLTIEGDGQLPPVSFQLEIICTSNPISFPALCKPVLRLCAIHYQDSTQSYPVRVRNNSSSNILVHWSIHNILDYRVSRKTHPFKLDLWDASDDPNDWGLTLNPFYGNVYLNTFSVDEPYFRLKSWTERTLTLNVNPRDVNFNADSAETPPLTLNAVLVGCVFPDPDFEQKHPDWDQSRMAAVETAHLLVKINLDKPKLVLLHDEVESMLQFFVRGEDLWNSRIYKRTRQFMWQNQSSVSTNVSIETEEPFKIELRQNGVKFNSLDRRIKLISGETLEMVLTLQITNGIGEIENLLEDIPVSPPSTQAEELRGSRLSRERKEVGKIAVYLDGHLDQVYDLELFITLPKLKLSVKKINFNPVYNGTSKCETFDIESEDCCPINFEIVPVQPISEEENVFSFYPSKGVVTSRKVPATISVYFTPKLSIFYMKKYLVKTAIPSHHLQFCVSGYGTYNSKRIGNEYPPKQTKSYCK